MSIVLQGSTSGSITLQEPAIAGSNTISLPAATGTAVLTGVSGNVDINAAGSNNVTLSTNSTERVRVDSSGNVGIGTSSPAGRLHVVGTSDQIRCGNGTNTAFLGASGSSGYTGTLTNDPFLFYTNSAERMRITSSGNLFVGTSSALGQSAKSVIVNNSSSDVGLIVQSSASGDVGIDGIRIGKFDNNTSTSQIFVRFTINNQGNGSGSITANGANACAFGSFSDERLKENIVDLPSQLENICNLRPVEFDYKDGSGHQIGFVAQEMQTVYPDVVAAGDDEMLMIGGWSKTEARLVKAIQELKGIVDTQATKIAELEAKLEGTA